MHSSYFFTKICSSAPYGSHIQQFKDDFEDLFAKRPTGRPDIDGFVDMLEKSYKDAKTQLQGLRPTGGPGKHHHDGHHEFKEAEHQV